MKNALLDRKKNRPDKFKLERVISQQKSKKEAPKVLTFVSDFGEIFSRIFKLWSGLLPRGGVFSRGASSLGIAALKLNAFTLLLMGEIVRSGDSVILCVIDRTGDDGESRLIDFALVSAMSRLACSLKRVCRSFWVSACV